jgi:RNase H-fold protein (predicted Holliday junction resolvase)
VLDAVTGGDAARLYQRCGWQPVGSVPNFALMPDGTRGDQANATMAFVGRLRPQTDVPIEFEDERFTSAVAQTKGGEAGLDARAAAELLQGWLDRQGSA